MVDDPGAPVSLQIVHGQVEAVNALCDHPDVAALTFVGSSKIAKIVHERCSKLGKRVLALGGAKNHLVSRDLHIAIYSCC